MKQQYVDTCSGGYNNCNVCFILLNYKTTVKKKQTKNTEYLTASAQVIILFARTCMVLVYAMFLNINLRKKILTVGGGSDL